MKFSVPEILTIVSTACRFNLLGDTNAPLGGGSTCLKRMLQQERGRTVFVAGVTAQGAMRQPITLLL